MIGRTEVERWRAPSPRRPASAFAIGRAGPETFTVEHRRRSLDGHRRRSHGLSKVSKVLFQNRTFVKLDENFRPTFDNSSDRSSIARARVRTSEQTMNAGDDDRQLASVEIRSGEARRGSSTNASRDLRQRSHGLSKVGRNTWTNFR